MPFEARNPYTLERLAPRLGRELRNRRTFVGEDALGVLSHLSSDHLDRCPIQRRRDGLPEDRVRFVAKVRSALADSVARGEPLPELRSTFLSARAAEEFAARRIADPKDRERLLGFAKDAMTGSIRKGAPLPAVRLRDQSARSNAAPSRAPSRKPEGPIR